MNEERARLLAEMAQFRREWLGGEWKKAKLPDLIEKLSWFDDAVVKHPHKWRDDVKISDEMRAIIDTAHERLVKHGMAENPIAFFQPSWTQAQILNAWHPDYAPDVAPKGYRTIMDVSAVRVGKTAVTIINKIGWLIPNNPEWLMFQPYTDFKGRRVEVLRRPNWDYWNRTGKMVYDPSEPPKSTCECWHGCPDEMHWKEKLDREYRKWMPMNCIGQRGRDPLWNISERWFETKWGSRVNGKLYMSDMQAWSGKELFIVTFDEGPPQDKLEEARIRTSYIWWAFTPREAANTGDRTKVAHDVYSGRYKLLPPMKTFQFSWDDVPEHIMPAERRKMRELMLSKDNAADRVTREGGFFFSSPNVFDAFRREKHVLPISGEQVMRAIRGELLPAELLAMPWLEKLRDANVFRGFDEGTAHPTACTWEALLKTGEKVIFREFNEAAHSITERAKRIIELSGNERQLVKVGETTEEMDLAREFANEIMGDRRREVETGAKLPRYRERFLRLKIRKTLADSKIFRRDPNHPLDDWTQNYNRAGLKMERATNAVPAARCDFANGLFLPDPTRQHLNPKQDDPDSPHGFQCYVTRDCEKLIGRLESYLHAQIQSGPRVGEFTGKPETKEDDIIDAFTYVACDRSRWVHPSTLIRSGDVDPKEAVAA
jgi:hypothetical protein